VVDIVHTVSHDYYLALEDGSGYRLVEQNTPLPFHTQAAFKLMHAEQRLAHFKFYNRVNEAQESIGDLWLSFDPAQADLDAQHVQEVLLDFEIDENNIITVAASLKEMPDITVSRTLSRGNVDEQLFLDLEESIAQVNREKRDYYVVYDFLHRAVGIANEINQVIDPETGEANEVMRQQAVRHQAIAEELVTKEATAFSNIYYAEAFLTEAGSLLHAPQRRALQKKIDQLKKDNEKGSADDILKSRDELLEELNKHPVLMSIKDLELALEIVQRENPAKAPRYEKYVHDVHNALGRNDPDTFGRLMQEILPEVGQILQDYESKDLHIWKEIRR
jgi:molecular chaperone DnaK (HSP70)